MRFRNEKQHQIFDWKRVGLGMRDGIVRINAYYLVVPIVLGDGDNACAMVAIAYPPKYAECIHWLYSEELGESGLDLARTYLSLLWKLKSSERAVVLGCFNLDLEGEICKYFEACVLHDWVYTRIAPMSEWDEWPDEVTAVAFKQKHDTAKMWPTASIFFLGALLGESPAVSHLMISLFLFWVPWLPK